jgi:hypothetical protein
MNTTTILTELEELFKAGSKPTEADFQKLIHTYVVHHDNKVGIGTSEPENNLDINGNAAIGSSYSGQETAPANGLIVEGNVGIGHNVADEPLHVNGNVKIENGNLYIGETLVINSAGEWTGPPVANEDGEGSTAWTDGDQQVTTASKVGINTPLPAAQLHVNGEVKVENGGITIGDTLVIDAQGNWANGDAPGGDGSSPWQAGANGISTDNNVQVNGLVTRQNVSFTAFETDGVALAGSKLLITSEIPQHEDVSFWDINNSVFQPDLPHAGTYCFMVSLTMAETKGSGRPDNDSRIFFSTNEASGESKEENELLIIREPNSGLHSSSSVMLYMDGDTKLSIHADSPDTQIAQITLSGHRL